jgi:serine protease Do
MKKLNFIGMGLFFTSLLQAKGWLGVHVEELTKAMKIALDVKCGVLVNEVVKDSPAEKGGLKIGDVILQFDNKEVENFVDLFEYVREKPNKEVKIKIKRKGKNEEIKITLGEREEESYYELEPLPLFPSGEMYRRLLKELKELKRNLRKLLKEKGKTYENLKEKKLLKRKFIPVDSGEI